MVKKIKKMDYQKKSNYFWTVVFGVIVVLIITFSIPAFIINLLQSIQGAGFSTYSPVFASTPTKYNVESIKSLLEALIIAFCSA